MAQPKEVHCPFCHHREMFDGPVGSTVRCRNCKSIFRLPAEGVKHGEKVKKYKVRRHSPAYYVILVVLVGLGIYAYVKVQRAIAARDVRLAEIWTKLDDPFKGRLQTAADTREGVVERFMECWKQGNQKSAETGDYTGFECMLLYVTPGSIPGGKLEEAVKGFKTKFGANEIKSYNLSARWNPGPNPNDPTVINWKVGLEAQTADGFVQKRGELSARLRYGKSERAARGQYIREHGVPGPDAPPIEPKDCWLVSVPESVLGWD